MSICCGWDGMRGVKSRSPPIAGKLEKGRALSSMLTSTAPFACFRIGSRLDFPCVLDSCWQNGQVSVHSWEGKIVGTKSLATKIPEISR